MHLLDSVDRWLLAAVLPQISDGAQSLRASSGLAFDGPAAGPSRASPPIGYLADRLRRPRLLAIGFAIWSMATVATGLARSYRPDSSGPRGGGRRQRDLRGCGPDDPHGPVSCARAVAECSASFFLAVPLGAALGLMSGCGIRR